MQPRYIRCTAEETMAAYRAIADRLRPQLNGTRLGQAVDADRVACAHVIIETVKRRGLAHRAAVIAVTTAIAESGLRNYTVATDHDSLGLFQQRVSIYTEPVAIDPVRATNAFLDAMLRNYPHDSWMSGDIGAICQGVQISANPGAYPPQVHDAQLLVDTLWADGPIPQTANTAGWLMLLTEAAVS